MPTTSLVDTNNTDEQQQQQLISNRSSYIHLLAGGLAGTFGAVLTCPLEVIKTRYQSSKNSVSKEYNHLNLRSSMSNTVTYSIRRPMPSPNKRPSIIASFRYILKYEGIPGLFKGLVPNLIGVAPSRAIYFFAYANTKTFLVEEMERETPLVHVTSAAAAGIAMSTCTNPLWFVKTRLQLDQGHLRAMDVVRNIYRQSGFRGFYKGISASYIGVSETIVHFVIYEQIKAQLQLMQANQNHSPDDPDLFDFLSYLGAAACSKSCASTLCYPHEVIRTRLREEGTKYRTLIQTIRTVIHEESLSGLYRGLLTHLIRQIPNTAIMMSTYEIVVALFSTNTTVSSSTTEVTTIQTKKVRLNQVDSEANALKEAEA
ncbi:unnamed protein product [Rotaria sp. Silwood1]|nr:unnamed protein product [Rotaria sp. Silwood1]CAF0945243.1 unnamed protein product [Rotaria sp. Silwood1]CAF3375658.1 unnamed protein product [Rotaria sp. Silwood1]CAF3395491.1 unnamed protein product [Rotaria sp. Silwood1]CAF3398655.1 unnamed protein product [Rotaria sp. Silwood1]